MNVTLRMRAQNALDNAHTWDYVALALGRPAVAVDLPGRGVRLADGRWTWRYDLFGPRGADDAGGGANWSDLTRMWEEVDTITVPAMLVRGGSSPYVRDEDVEQFQRRLPFLRYEVVTAPDTRCRAIAHSNSSR